MLIEVLLRQGLSFFSLTGDETTHGKKKEFLIYHQEVLKLTYDLPQCHW